ncbi:putative pro-resilin [Iris pallida]|uniref:Pro-resilin n=1 Tax=Iris pallida TaxID=29817 RepID=A0AAX6G1P6_IRIPA|nr:putative pro-resilin [Iris pallida]
MMGDSGDRQCRGDAGLGDAPMEARFCDDEEDGEAGVAWWRSGRIAVSSLPGRLTSIMVMGIKKVCG